MTDNAMNIDLDLVMLDFEQAYGDDSRRALHAVMALLLDRDACQARIELLRQVTEGAHADFPHLRARAGQDDFGDVIRQIESPGTIRAVEQGLLDPQRLHQLTCHPDALWQAHLALTEFPDDPPETDGAATTDHETHLSAAGDTHIGQAQAEGGTITQLAAERDWGALKAQLRRFLPPLLLHVGMDVGFTDDLLEFVVRRAGDLEGRRFRECLAGWLGEFADQHEIQQPPAELSTEDWVRIIETTAVTDVLSQTAADEPDWARTWRQTALQQHPTTPRQLLSVELPESSADRRIPDLAKLRHDLYLDAREQVDQALRLLELN